MSDKVLNVIVTYNRLNDLKVCVENIKAQMNTNYVNFHIQIDNKMKENLRILETLN